MIELVNGNKDSLKGKATIYAKLEDCAKFRNKFPVSFENGRIISRYVTTDVSEFPSCKKDRYRKISVLYNLMKELNLNPSRFPFYSTEYTLNPIGSDISRGSEDMVYVGEHKTLELCLNKLSLGELCYFRHLWRQSINQEDMYADIKFSEPKETIVKPNDFKGNELTHYLVKRYISPILSARERRDYTLVGILKKSLEGFLDNPHHAQDALDLSSIFEKDAITDLDKDLIYSIVSKISAVNTENYELAEEIKDKIFCLKKGYRV